MHFLLKDHYLFLKRALEIAPFQQFVFTLLCLIVVYKHHVGQEIKTLFLQKSAV